MWPFKSREQEERDAAIEVSRRAAKAVGLVLSDALGIDVLLQFNTTVGALLLKAGGSKMVEVASDKPLLVAASQLLVAAGLLEYVKETEGYVFGTFAITDRGRSVCRDVFHDPRF